jgi:hypothetical protein
MKLRLRMILAALLYLITGCGRIVETRAGAAKGSPSGPVTVSGAAIGCSYIGHDGGPAFCRVGDPAIGLAPDQVCYGRDGCNEGSCKLENGTPTLYITTTRVCIKP